MTWGRRDVLLIATLISLVTCRLVVAQDATGERSSSNRGSGQAKTPSPAGRKSNAARINPQGFSVVLVVADLQSSSAQDDVPPAARRALSDMKEFLPYKSYKLVDAAWVLGHGMTGTVTRLRGPDEQEYELRLNASPTEVSRVFVRFSLSDLPLETGVEALVAHAAQEREAQSSIERLERELARLQSEMEAAKEKRDEARVRQLQREIEQARASRPARAQTRTASGRSSRRAIIDTSFTMDVGERVVVGTSRLKGNSKALIALLTAVPPRSSDKK
jgi:hypothetical protein